MRYLCLLTSFILIFSVPSYAQNTKNLRVRKNLRVKGKTILKDVVITGSAVIQGDATISGETNLSLPADSVQLEESSPNGSTGSSSIRSSNLQDALDNEIAIDVAAVLPGTSWQIMNYTTDDTFSNRGGRITFNEEGTALTLDAGRFAAAGLVHADQNTFCGTPAGDVQYKLFGRDLLYMSWTVAQNQTAPDATMTIFMTDKDSIRLVGSGGCGRLGSQRISILTRITEE